MAGKNIWLGLFKYRLSHKKKKGIHFEEEKEGPYVEGEEKIGWMRIEKRNSRSDYIFWPLSVTPIKSLGKTSRPDDV